MNNDRGFSFIGVIVSIVIIGILVMIAVPNYLGTQDNDVETYEKALDIQDNYNDKINNRMNELEEFEE